MARTKSPSGNKQKDPIASGTAGIAAASALENPSESRKLGVVKSDSRPTLIPINLEDEIRRRAYELSERRGFEAGHETEDWLDAEREVRQRYRQQTA